MINHCGWHGVFLAYILTEPIRLASALGGRGFAAIGGRVLAAGNHVGGRSTPGWRLLNPAGESGPAFRHRIAIPAPS